MNEWAEADILIVGAGMSGLMAAGALQAAGRRVMVVDKGSSVGGRLATRRLGNGRADHGAQFFTVRESAFQAYVGDWLAAGVVYEWTRGFSSGSADAAPPDGHPRYAARGGLNALAKHLAGQLGAGAVRVGVQLKALNPHATGWLGLDAAGVSYAARAVVLTPPVPQSLALLDAGGAVLTASDRAALDRIAYAPCLAGLFRLDGAAALPEPGAIQRPDADVTWIADNRRKGISDETILTVHAGPALSQALYDAPDAEILAALRAAAAPFLPPGVQELEAQVKKWRYAQPTVMHPARCLRAAGLPPLVFAGDAFDGPRVEGAALSGLAAAQMLLDAG